MVPPAPGAATECRARRAKLVPPAPSASVGHRVLPAPMAPLVVMALPDRAASAARKVSAARMARAGSPARRVLRVLLAPLAPRVTAA